MNTIEVLSFILLIAACVSITWSSEAINVKKYRGICAKEFTGCFMNAGAPRKRRLCVLHFAKCVQSIIRDYSFQGLRREYKEALDYFRQRRDVDWW
ncbi:hypothetical protein ScPMuIL_013392 [Solemya velum]